MFHWRSICLFAGWQALWWVMEHTDEQDKSFQNKFLPSHDDRFLTFPCSLQQWNCFVWRGERERDLGLIVSRIFLNESRLGFNWMLWKVLLTLSSLLQHAWCYFVIVDTDPTVHFRSYCRSLMQQVRLWCSDSCDHTARQDFSMVVGRKDTARISLNYML